MKNVVCLTLTLVYFGFMSCGKVGKVKDCPMNSPPMRSEIIKFIVKPGGTAKKVIISATSNLVFPQTFRGSDVMKNATYKNENNIQFEINENLPKQGEIIIYSDLLDANTKYSIDIGVYEGRNQFFKKQVAIKTGKGESDDDCVWDIALTTLEEVKIDDMQYVVKVAKKGVFSITNEAVVLKF